MTKATKAGPSWDPRVRTMVAVLASALLLAGCYGPDKRLPPEWKGRDLTKPGWTNTTLQPEYTLVLEYPKESGDKIAWDFLTANGYVYFQVLKSEGKASTKLVGRHADDEKDSLTTPSAGVYQIVWMNDAPFPLSFTWQTSEGYSQRLYPPNEGPGCTILLC